MGGENWHVGNYLREILKSEHEFQEKKCSNEDFFLTFVKKGNLTFLEDKVVK